jgi:hypothetical protein
MRPALCAPGQGTAGMGQMCQGLAALWATGDELRRPQYLAPLAAAYGGIGQSEAGLYVLAEVLATVEKTGGRFYEAELYRRQGELRRRQTLPDENQAEACFRQAQIGAWSLALVARP